LEPPFFFFFFCAIFLRNFSAAQFFRDIFEGRGKESALFFGAIFSALFFRRYFFSTVFLAHFPRVFEALFPRDWID
jgi:hypothetical protein